MAALAWYLLGALVVVAILALGLRLNRAKAAAQLAVRLAEAYRTRGDFETAIALYGVPRKLYQNVSEADEGMQLARDRDTRPLMDETIVKASAEEIARDRAALRNVLARAGAEVELPELP